MIHEIIHHFFLEKHTLGDIINELKTVKNGDKFIIFSYSKDFVDRIGFNCIEKTAKTKLENEFIVFKDKTLTIRDITISKLIQELEKIHKDNQKYTVDSFSFGRAKLYININFK